MVEKNLGSLALTVNQMMDHSFALARVTRIGTSPRLMAQVVLCHVLQPLRDLLWLSMSVRCPASTQLA